MIDDDESISEVIQIFLEEQGYKVKSYVDGLDIVGKINKAKPGIILLDYLLPGKNGVEIAREIRKKLSARKLPLIMIAAIRSIRKNLKPSVSMHFWRNHLIFMNY